jgi:hypothetical protein
MRGTFRLNWNVFAVPQQEGSGYRLPTDPDTWRAHVNQELQDSLAAQASNGPVQFVWVPDNRNPADLYLTVQMHARGSNGNSAAEYWGEAWVNQSASRGKSILLFHFTTHAYGGDEFESSLLNEAASTSYSYLANGWTCGQNSGSRMF